MLRVDNQEVARSVGTGLVDTSGAVCQRAVVTAVVLRYHKIQQAVCVHVCVCAACMLVCVLYVVEVCSSVLACGDGPVVQNCHCVQDE